MNYPLEMFDKDENYMRFLDIAIDREDIPQSDLNIESRVRTNLFAWNGQFSPQFVEALLLKYAKSGIHVIDPFLGSGTTIYECARQGYAATGIELNPSAYHIAKLYELCNLNSSERSSIIKHVDTILSKDIDIQFIIKSAIEPKDITVANVLSALIVLLDIYNNDISPEFIAKKWDKLKSTIIELPFSSNNVSVILGDSNTVKVSPDIADLLITSPPYINVFNYHQKYRRSVELLGYKVLNIAKGEFGSNRKNRGNRLLTVVQYCIDMALSLRASSMFCKPDARMIYVVGRESTVLGYAFCNSELIYRIATEVLGFTFLLRQERVFKNRYGQFIFEDILHFSNVKTCTLAHEIDIISKARKIAVDALLEKKHQFPNSDNLLYIDDAINKSISVKKSEANYE